jgi:hypothetical protein
MARKAGRVDRTQTRDQLMQDEAARKWLESKLRIGGALARAALQMGVPKDGEIALIAGHLAAPPHVEFEGSAGVYQNHSDEVLNATLRKWIGNTDGYLIVEDDLATPDDVSVRDRSGETFVAGRDVYHWLALESPNDADLADFVRGGASGYPTIAFIVTRITEPPWRSGALDDFGMARLTRAIAVVIVSAFDDEGWVAWRRQDGSSSEPQL